MVHKSASCSTSSVPQSICCKRTLIITGTGQPDNIMQLKCFAGAEWSTLNPSHTWSRWERSCLYNNEVTASKPRYLAMSFTLLSHPLHLVQVTTPTGAASDVLCCMCMSLVKILHPTDVRKHCLHLRSRPIFACSSLILSKHCLQAVELAFHVYERYYWYAGLLCSITLLSSFTAVAPLYQKRLQLYSSVVSQQVIPLLQAGRVR